MRRIALLLFGLCLTTGFVGCKDEAADDAADTPAATPADTDADTTEEAAETP